MAVHFSVGFSDGIGKHHHNNSFGAIDGLLDCKTASFHADAYRCDQSAEIDAFADSIDYVTAQQTSEMVNIDGASICFVRERGEKQNGLPCRTA